MEVGRECMVLNQRMQLKHKRMMLCESSAMQQEILCFSVEQVVTTAACKTCGVRFPRCLVTFRANVATPGWQQKKNLN